MIADAATPLHVRSNHRAGALSLWIGALLLPPLTLASSGSTRRAGDDLAAARAIVQQAQDRLIDTIERVAPAVVCIYDQHEQGGGSGVVIDPQGYGLTNFHVIAGMLSTRRGLGGVSDGTLYDLEVLGIDPTGDVAMFRLRGRDDFPYAELGDSDTVRVGDLAIALGNPFTLSEDYAPTVTSGLITGVHRYQWGVGNNLIYSDCIQTDASINPGNSGGPLINERGEIIGINGRISVNTRGRYNVGHGYAISANQIRRFLPALRAGLLAKHGTLQATVQSTSDNVVVFDNVRAGFAADRAGVRIGDRLRYLDHMPIDTPNRFASAIGTYPANWTVTLTLERDGEPLTLRVCLDALEPELRQPFEPSALALERATSRVLEAYHRAVLGPDESAALPTRITGTATRIPSSTRSGARGETQRYSVEWSADGPMRLQFTDDAGSVRRIVEVDAQRATQRYAEQADRFDLPPDEAMILRAVYVGQIRLLAANRLRGRSMGDLTTSASTGDDLPPAAPDTTSLTHVGGDALPVEWSLGAGRRGVEVAEVLRLTIGEGLTADYSFEITSGLLAAVRVVDSISGVSASATLYDYHDVRGVQWPTGLRVELPGQLMIDRFSDLEVSR